MTETDLIGIDTHGFIYEFGIYGEMIIDLQNAKVYVEKCMMGFDRGNYKFIVENKPGKEHICEIDFADFFPRYFFSLQRAIDEMKDWIDINSRRTGNPQMIGIKKQNLFPDIS